MILLMYDYSHINIEMKTQDKNQTDLGKVLGISQSAANQFLKGRRKGGLNIREAEIISKWLSKSLTWVFYGKENVEKDSSLARIEKALTIQGNQLKNLGDAMETVYEIKHKTKQKTRPSLPEDHKHV